MAARAECETILDPRVPAADDGATTEEGAAGILFNPPLYIQRYKLVTDFVAKTNARKVNCSTYNWFCKPYSSFRL